MQHNKQVEMAERFIREMMGHGVLFIAIAQALEHAQEELSESNRLRESMASMYAKTLAKIKVQYPTLAAMEVASKPISVSVQIEKDWPSPLSDEDKDLVLIPHYLLQPWQKEEAQKRCSTVPWGEVKKSMSLTRRIKSWLQIQHRLFIIRWHETFGDKG